MENGAPRSPEGLDEIEILAPVDEVDEPRELAVAGPPSVEEEAPSGSSIVLASAGERPLILACGPVSGWVRRLMVHRGVDLLSTRSLDAAIRVARHDRPRIYVTSDFLDDGTALDLLQGLTAVGSTAPCVVALELDCWSRAESCLAAGAIDVVEVGDDPRLLKTVAPALGLPYGDAVRAPYEGPVEVEIGGRSAMWAGIDLRPTGLAVSGLGGVPAGTLARVGLWVAGRKLFVSARVVRSPRDRSAFRFVAVSREFVEWLGGAILEGRKRGIVPSGSEPLDRFRVEVRSALTGAAADPVPSRSGLARHRIASRRHALRIPARSGDPKA